MRNVKFFFTVVVSIVVLSTSAFAGGKTPGDVYHYNFSTTLPLYYALAVDKGASIPKYKFPKRVNKSMAPADVYTVMYEAYEMVSKKYPSLAKIIKKGAADVVPSDVFALSQTISTNLKTVVNGAETPPAAKAIVADYETWKKNSRADGKGIVPGDVATLGKHFKNVAKGL